MSDFVEKLNELMNERETCIETIQHYTNRKTEIELQLSVIREQLSKIHAENGGTRSSQARSEAMKRAWARRREAAAALAASE